LGDRVHALHIKDDTYKGDKRSHNVVIGQANLDVVGVFKALKEIRFPADGSISLEYESNPDNPIDEMKQCLAVAREAIAQRYTWRSIRDALSAQLRDFRLRSASATGTIHDSEPPGAFP
jgi:L-ribulose-5-phosphate 3-epimerase UlaE